MLDRYVNANEHSDEAEVGALGDGGSQPATRLDGAAVDALRLEEIELWDRAARGYAELGPDHLRDRFQCLNNAAWTEQERGDAQAGAARVSALIDEVRALPEDDVPDWVLPSAERLLARLNEGE